MNKDNEELKNKVNSLSCLVLGGTEVNPQEWKKKIPAELYEDKKGPKYKGNEVCDLVRLTRNKVRVAKTFCFMDTARDGATMGSFRVRP